MPSPVAESTLRIRIPEMALLVTVLVVVLPSSTVK